MTYDLDVFTVFVKD